MADAWFDLDAKYFAFIPLSDYTWGDTSGFNAWGGYRRVYGDKMRLAFSNMSSHPGLNIQNSVFHYRWGTLQNHHNTPDDALDAVSVGDVEITADGVKANDASSYINLPHDPGDLQFLYESSPSSSPVPPTPDGVIDSFVAGAWVNYTYSNSPKAIMGGHFTDGPSSASPEDRDVASFQLMTLPSNETSSTTLACNVHTRKNGVGAFESYFYNQSQIALANGLHHILSHQFFVVTATEKWWYGRWFVDGKFVAENKARLDAGYAWYANSTTEAIKSSMMASKPFALLAVKQSGPEWSAPTPWGEMQVANSLDATIDEAMMANCHPVLSGGDPVVAQSWNAGDTIFATYRHPNPSVWGVSSESFVMFSPVVFAGYGSDGGIYKCKIAWDGTLASGQSIGVSVRGGSRFEADDTTIPWSDWIVLYDAQNGAEVNISGGGYGNSVQIRLRIFPSNDTARASSPAVSSVKWWAAIVDLTPISYDLSAKYSCPPYFDLPAKYRNFQSVYYDLPAKYRVVIEADPYDLPAKYRCLQTVSHDLPAKYRQTAVHYDLSAKYNRPFWTSEHDLPAKYNCIRVEYEIPAKYRCLGIKSYDLSAKYNCTAYLLSAKYRCLQTASHDLPAKYRSVPEKPGTVNPVTATAPQSAWVIEPSVIFDWHIASFISDPILAYYWKVTQNATEGADATWNNRTSTTAAINMNTYGGGVWYFHVAARNTGGYFGVTSHYAIWFNSPPSVPGMSFMRVNGADAMFGQPIVGHNSTPALTWSPSEDPDDGNVITYDLQISTQSDFGLLPVTGLTSIVRNVTDLPNPTYNFDEIGKTGTLYWRTRANDSHQLSAWSGTAAMRVNVPPNKPTGLIIAGIA